MDKTMICPESKTCHINCIKGNHNKPHLPNCDCVSIFHCPSCIPYVAEKSETDKEFMRICNLALFGECVDVKCPYFMEHFEGDDCEETCNQGGHCIPVPTQEQEEMAKIGVAPNDNKAYQANLKMILCPVADSILLSDEEQIKCRLHDGQGLLDIDALLKAQLRKVFERLGETCPHFKELSDGEIRIKKDCPECYQALKKEAGL